MVIGVWMWGMAFPLASLVPTERRDPKLNCPWTWWTCLGELTGQRKWLYCQHLKWSAHPHYPDINIYRNRRLFISESPSLLQLSKTELCYVWSLYSANTYGTFPAMTARGIYYYISGRLSSINALQRSYHNFPIKWTTEVLSLCYSLPVSHLWRTKVGHFVKFSIGSSTLWRHNHPFYR